MKASKIYTAQEMREMADAIINECEDEEAGLVYESPAKAGHVFYPDEASAMLRQAAAMFERAYTVIAKAKKANETQTSFGCRTCVENYIKEINYILRGDAEEGGEDGFKRD